MAKCKKAKHVVISCRKLQYKSTDAQCYSHVQSIQARVLPRSAALRRRLYFLPRTAVQQHVVTHFPVSYDVIQTVAARQNLACFRRRPHCSITVTSVLSNVDQIVQTSWPITINSTVHKFWTNRFVSFYMFRPCRTFLRKNNFNL
jgi:hypothetical protein